MFLKISTIMSYVDVIFTYVLYSTAVSCCYVDVIVTYVLYSTAVSCCLEYRLRQAYSAELQTNTFKNTFTVPYPSLWACSH